MIHRNKVRWAAIFSISLLLIQLLTLHVFAGGGDEDKRNGQIKGTVTTNDGMPAVSVSVQVKGSAKATITEEDGSFLIKNMRPGEYQLQVTLIGYENALENVTVEEGKTATVNIALKLSGAQLQEVTVRSGRSPYTARQVSTSLRLNEPILETPQNIQIITNKVMVDQQIISMSDGLIRNVSGLMRLEHWGDMYTNINARGSRLSAFRNGMNTITSYWSPLTEDMSFVDHVEFVKGPAGFMMSVGDPAGIYNVVTKKPSGITKGEVGIMMGSYDLFRATTDFEGKLDKEGKILYRLNLMGQTKNSFRAYEYNNRYSIAPVISFKLDENTTLTAEYIRQHVKTSNVGSYYVFSTKGYAVLPRDYTLSDPGLEPTYITEQIATLSLSHKLNDYWKLNAQASYYDYRGKGSSMWVGNIPDPLHPGEFIPAIQPDSMIRNVSIWDAVSTAKFGQVYLNGDVRTGLVHHRILAGLDANHKDYMADWNQGHDLDRNDAWFKFADPQYGAPSNGYPVWDRTTPLVQRAGPYAVVSQSLVGVYLQDELGFFENKLRVTLAGRYTHVKQVDYGAGSSANKFTPRIGLSYSVDDETAVYGVFDQAFVPQTGFRKDLKTVKPLTGNNTELGVKREWAGGKWNSSLSVFRILRNNENSSDPSDATGKYIVQLGQSRAQGIEFDIRGELLPGLTLTANYALTDNQITKANDSAKATIGNKVPGYAKHTANAWLNYKIQEGVLKGFGISGGMTFLGTRSTWSWTGATGEIALPDYTKFDGGIFWEQDRLRISCNVFNLADKYLYTGAAYGAYYYWQAEAGRNWRLGINYRF